MTRTKNTSKFPLSTSQIITYTMLVVLTVAVVILANFVWVLNASVNNLVKNPLTVATMTVNAVEGLVVDIPSDPRSGQLFMHEAKLTLPAPGVELGNFVYRYNQASSENPELFPEYISIASRTLLNRSKVPVLGGMDIEDSLEDLPEMQACARGYRLYFIDKPEEALTKAFEKKLTDGRMVYVYHEEACADMRSEIIDFLKQVDSY